MDLRRGLLDLVAPLRVGDEIAPGARLTDVSTDLGLRLSFDVSGRSVHVEVSPATDGGRFAARTPRLFIAYRSPVLAPVPASVGLDLCRTVAALATPNEDAVLDGFAEEAARAANVLEGGARIREVRVERMLERGVDAGRAFYTVNPYVGCLVGCRFCYAQSRTSIVRRLEGLPDLPWGSYTEVRINAAQILAGELTKLEPAPLKFCPIVSDAYQPVERRYRVTRGCLEAIAASGRAFPPLILTRTEYILDDLDVLASIPGAGAGASIPTYDDDVRRHFEPRAISIPQRFAMLRALRAAGVHTYAVVQPMLPGPVEELADALADAVESVWLEILRSVEGAEREFADPRFAHARDPDWQERRRAELESALVARNVPLWVGELPPSS